LSLVTRNRRPLEEERSPIRASVRSLAKPVHCEWLQPQCSHVRLDWGDVQPWVDDEHEVWIGGCEYSLQGRPRCRRFRL
jgi:hypothetical protein